MTIPLISVIVPTYNRGDMLGDALRSLLGQETGGQFSYEIVVVDNASTDETKTTVQRVAEQAPVVVRYLYHDVPGDGPSRNCGVAACRGDWLAFFDDDQLAAPDWLRQLYQAAVETGAPVIGGAVVVHLSEEVLDRFGPYVRRTTFRETDPRVPAHPFVGKQLPGCANVLVARHVFETVGKFDVSMAWGGSDSDFFLRARAAGLVLYFTPHAVIRHRMPPNRLTPEYHHWDAQQGCDSLACLDYRYKGRLRLVLLCLARIAQTLLILLPGLAWARLRNDARIVLDYQVRLWRTAGYVHRTLALLAPRWFAQEEYFTNLKFRKGRTIGQPAAQVEAVA
jgi:glycosyltransferase involved in cell wall biosynthesis